MAVIHGAVRESTMAVPDGMVGPANEVAAAGALSALEYIIISHGMTRHIESAHGMPWASE